MTYKTANYKELGLFYLVAGYTVKHGEKKFLMRLSKLFEVCWIFSRGKTND